LLKGVYKTSNDNGAEIVTCDSSETWFPEHSVTTLKFSWTQWGHAWCADSQLDISSLDRQQTASKSILCPTFQVSQLWYLYLTGGWQVQVVTQSKTQAARKFDMEKFLKQ